MPLSLRRLNMHSLLAAELGLPPNTPADARFGHLCSEHGLQMHEVRTRVEKICGKTGPEQKP